MISANHKCLFFILLIVGIFRGYQCIGSDEENVGSDEENVDSGIGQGWVFVNGNKEEDTFVSKGNEKVSKGNEKDRRESSKSKTNRRESKMYPDRRESKMYPEMYPDHTESSKSITKTMKNEKKGGKSKTNLTKFLESNSFLEAFEIAYQYLTINDFYDAKKSSKIDILRIAFAYFHYIYNTIVKLILTTYDASIEDFNYAYFNLTIDDYKNTIDDYKNTINDFDDAINDFDDEPKKDVYNSIFNIVLQELQKIDLKVATTLMNIEEFKKKYKNRTLPKKYYNIKIPN